MRWWSGGQVNVRGTPGKHQVRARGRPDDGQGVRIGSGENQVYVR